MPVYAGAGAAAGSSGEGSGGWAKASSSGTRATAAPQATDSGIRAARHSTVGSVALIVSAMLVVVSLTLGGVALLGKKPEAKPAAAATARPAIAVMMFENRTGEPRYNWYADNTGDLLRVVLAQLGQMDVISKQRLMDVLGEMKVAGDPPVIDSRISTDVARKSGATLMVRGEALRLAGSVILTAEMVDVGTGRVMGAERVTGVNEENMLDKVDELGRLLSRRLEVVR
jgi:TolB-like protein